MIGKVLCRENSATRFQPSIRYEPVAVLAKGINVTESARDRLRALPELHQVFPQHTGAPGPAVSAPPDRRVAPIPLADAFVPHSSPAEGLAHFQDRGEDEGLGDRHPAVHVVPAPLFLMSPGLPEGRFQVPGLARLNRRLRLVGIPVACGRGPWSSPGPPAPSCAACWAAPPYPSCASRFRDGCRDGG